MRLLFLLLGEFYMTIVPYLHKAQYYETDQMGIIHHSNYIRWFEEARVDYLEQVGMGYGEMERHGISSPVLAVTCEYKTMTRFGETVRIAVWVAEYTGVKLRVAYRVEDAATGQLRCTGESRHCFLNREGRPVSLKRAAPQYHETFLAMLQAGQPAE